MGAAGWSKEAFQMNQFSVPASLRPAETWISEARVTGVPRPAPSAARVDADKNRR